MLRMILPSGVILEFPLELKEIFKGSFVVKNAYEGEYRFFPQKESRLESANERISEAIRNYDDKKRDSRSSPDEASARLGEVRSI